MRMARDKQRAVPREREIIWRERHAKIRRGREPRRIQRPGASTNRKQVHARLRRRGDGSSRSIKQRNAIRERKARDDARARRVGCDVDVHDAAAGQAEVRLEAAEHGVRADEEVVVVGDVELAVANQRDGVGCVEERVLDGAQVRCRVRCQVQMEHLDGRGGVAAVVGDEEGGGGLVVGHA